MLQKPQSSYFVTCIATAACLLAFSGCQTFKSTFTSMPKLPKLSDMKLPAPGKLAFWNREADSVPPPPPSRHLNPSLSEGVELASRSADEIDIDQYRRKIDQMKDSLASAAEKSGFADKPLRSPYDAKPSGSQFDRFKSDIESIESSIDQKVAAAKKKANTFGKGTFSEARQKFEAAVADVKKPLDNDFRSPGDVISSNASTNGFKQALANSKLKSTIDAATKNVSLDESLAKVNQSLYDINGNLTTGAAAASNAAAESVEAARERFSTALGSVNSRTEEIARASNELGGELKKKFAAADNSFKSSLARAADSVNEKVASLGTGFDFPKPQSSSPAFKRSPSFGNRTAEPQKPEETFGGGSFNRTRVANVTPVESPATHRAPANSALARTGIDSSLTGAWNNGSKQSQLKPIGVAARSSNPDNRLRTASLNSGGFHSELSASSIASSFERGSAAPASHVSDIDIPAKILSGSGSYAPGSVNKVR